MDKTDKKHLNNSGTIIIPELVYSNVTEIIDRVEEPFKDIADIVHKEFVKSINYVVKSKCTDKIMIPVKQIKYLVDIVASFIVKEKKLSLKIDYLDLFELTTTYLVDTLKLDVQGGYYKLFYLYIDIMDKYLTGTGFLGRYVEENFEKSLNMYNRARFLNKSNLDLIHGVQVLSLLYSILKSQLKNSGGDMYIVKNIMSEFTTAKEVARSSIFGLPEYKTCVISYYIVENIS